MKLQEVYKETLNEFKAISLDCELLEKLKCHIKAVKRIWRIQNAECENCVGHHAMENWNVKNVRLVQ